MRHTFVPFLLFLGLAQAQFMPSPQLCNPTQITGAAAGEVDEHGEFDLTIDVGCQPTDAKAAFPQGNITLQIEMNDPRIAGELRATVLEGVRTVGTAAPLAFLSGQCELDGIVGCRFWLFVADNDHKGGATPDMVSFLILDALGREIAYASAPVEDSSLSIEGER